MHSLLAAWLHSPLATFATRLTPSGPLLLQDIVVVWVDNPFSTRLALKTGIRTLGKTLPKADDGVKWDTFHAVAGMRESMAGNHPSLQVRPAFGGCGAVLCMSFDSCHDSWVLHAQRRCPCVRRRPLTS